MNKINIKKLSPEDWQIYKSLRLNSLKDSPDSFGSSFDRESEFPDGEWSSRLSNEGKPMDGLLVVAELNNTPVGLVCGMVHNEGDPTGKVYQMWVSSEARGCGIGKLLLDHIISWAKNAGLQNLSLGVTTTNTAAISLYQSSGFIFDGSLEELRAGSDLKVQPMILRLHTSNIL